TIKASTEIYEQRLLVTGPFDDRPTYDKFEAGVRGVARVKQLYWHVVYMSDADQNVDKQEGDHLLDAGSEDQFQGRDRPCEGQGRPSPQLPAGDRRLRHALRPGPGAIGDGARPGLG
ncbi:MAG: hypothetical protein ACREEN_11860, partial [Stellaceae bacterium]